MAGPGRGDSLLGGGRVMSFADWLIARVARRAPDFVIGGEDRPYLRRWWLIPRNPIANVYLHEFLRSDDDRALHDHPWPSVSVILRGGYVEHTPDGAFIRLRGDVVARKATALHRVELGSNSCWTLFLTGPRIRQWGFQCGDRWVHWKLFTASEDPGAIGKGCDA